MRISSPILQAWTEKLLGAAGLSAEHAQQATEVFLQASLRCVGHHDIHYLPQRLQWLRTGPVNPRPQLTLVTQNHGVEVWDGDEGLGEICCSHVTNRAMELARTQGIGLATIRRSNHFLAASPYAERGADRGFLILVFSNTDPGMTAPGGFKKIIGNNPLGFGLPGTSSGKMVLDLCLAYSSLGNLKSLQEREMPVPDFWGVNAQGRGTTEPGELLNGGAVHPIAHHKGFGLALLVESLTGILSGGATTNQVTTGGGLNTHNQTVIAIDLAGLGGVSAIEARVNDMEVRLKADEPSLRLPGERSQSLREEAQDLGIPLSEELYQELVGWSRNLGLVAADVPLFDSFPVV